MRLQSFFNVQSLVAKFGLVVFFLSSCGSPQPSIMASTPQPTESARQKFEEPTAQLNFDIAKTDWSPAVIGPAGARMLSEALNQKKSLMVITGSHMQDTVLEDKIFQMVKASAPQTKIVARNSGVLDEILIERGEIPYRKTWEVGGQDILGRPYMVPKDHPLKTDWLSKKKALKGAEAILLLDFVSPDDQKLRQMRGQVQGGCGSLLSEMERGAAQATSYFDAIVGEVNAALASEFSRQMQSALPFWKKELAQAVTTVAATSQEARCYNAYQKYLSTYDDCLSEACALAPALHVEGAGVLGMEMSGAAVIPNGCPEGMGRNYVNELAAIGERVTKQIMADIPETWAGEFAKIRMLERLTAELEDMCSPAHRRFSPDDLETAQTAVNKFIEQVVSEKQLGKFVSAEGKERISGVGSVRVFGRAEQSGGHTSVLVKQLRGIFSPLNKCRDSKRRPVQVVLVDVGSSEVYFSAIVFEEQLFCEALPLQ